MSMLGTEITAELRVDNKSIRVSGEFSAVGDSLLAAVIHNKWLTGRYQIGLVDPAELAKLSSDEIESLKGDDNLGFMFLALELKLANQKQFHIKQKLIKEY